MEWTELQYDGDQVYKGGKRPSVFIKVWEVLKVFRKCFIKLL